jgi:uncharacterized protein DUF6152
MVPGLDGRRIFSSRRARLTQVAFALLLPAAPALAHHSFAAEFDAAKPVGIFGSVTRVDWSNPHVYLYLDAKDASGTIVHWRFEMGSPNTLLRCGWTKDSVRAGDKIAVTGYRAKDGSYSGYTARVTRADGRIIYSRPPGDLAVP